ncbi:MFS general substrate transporter [Xylaria bambusicola]|uniref:MFS general substrate transporter n=1 Tax=Xylaria bambusicola TaxID=326684 RepID=UPI002008C1F9|nr:MFS general substrate transporter [Xylaria bambusicola]KAI0517865.1 MFS general substrate transporter [Xylaria bambusicola]
MAHSINGSSPSSHGEDPEKNAAAVSDNGAHEITDDADPREHTQEGVKQVEAITTVFDKKLLIIMFILLYLVSFIDALAQSVGDSLTPYVTSSFGQHGLLTTASLIARIIGGVISLTIAKIIDIWGRCEGFVVMVIITIIGEILKAVSHDVETYAAATTLYWVGHIGMNYVITIMLADMTTLKNRLIIFGIQGTPGIATVFAGSRIADLFYHQSNFRWAFGAFAILLAAFAIPVCLVFVWAQRKASKQGLIQPRDSGRTVWQAVKYYFVEFDVVGMFLTVFGFVLLLLPFSLTGYAPYGWRTPYIIAMFIVGGVLLAAFVLWERFFAPVQYFPFKYLKDRTILAACGLYGVMFLSIFCWDAYYGSYLQVVHGLSITTSNYVLNGLSLASMFIGPFVGLFISKTGAVKWAAIIGIPFVVLGTVLLVEYRKPSTPVGLLVLFQILNGLGDGIWTPVAQLAVMAQVPHQQVAVGLALFGLFGSIGSAIGNAIAGALWNNVLPQKLEEFLPDDVKNRTAEIFGSIVVQQSFPFGTPERDAIVAAYGDVQRKLVIAGSAFLPLAIVFIFVWKNINVKKLESSHGTQAKGTIF